VVEPVSLVDLALAIMAAGALVWLASAALWMALPHHQGDYRPLPQEEDFAALLRRSPLRPGQYIFPHLQRWEDTAQAEGRRRFEQGPVGYLTIMPNRVPSISRHMLLTLAYYLLVAAGIAWAASLFIPRGAPYGLVFRAVAAMALLAHGAAIIPEGIWYGKPWGNVLRSLFDAGVYALLTAGAFAGLWPDAPLG
jgi:hypothetical protein